MLLTKAEFNESEKKRCGKCAHPTRKPGEVTLLTRYWTKSIIISQAMQQRKWHQEEEILSHSRMTSSLRFDDGMVKHDLTIHMSEEGDEYYFDHDLAFHNEQIQHTGWRKGDFVRWYDEQGKTLVYLLVGRRDRNTGKTSLKMRRVGATEDIDIDYSRCKVVRRFFPGYFVWVGPSKHRISKVINRPNHEYLDLVLSNPEGGDFTMILNEFVYPF